jgi:hypothetical protein
LGIKERYRRKNKKPLIKTTNTMNTTEQTTNPVMEVAARENAPLNSSLENAVGIFMKHQTLTNLEAVKALGVKLKRLNNAGTKWEEAEEFTLPLYRSVKLYGKVDGMIKLTGIGIY